MTSMEPITGRFYKYRATGSVGGKHWDRLVQIVRDRSIYFARPSTLNDPYDCRPATTAPSVGEVRRVAKKMHRSVKKRYGLKGKNPKGVNTTTQAVLRMRDPQQRTEDVFTALDQRTAVFCTSLNGLSNQQWAYYADSHRGVCLEFELADKETFFAIPIAYSDRRPVIDVAKFVTDDEYREKSLTEAISTKSLDWAHEQEVRWLQKEEGAVQYPPEMLTGIIFGLAAPDEVVDELSSLVASLELPPKLYQCRMELESFELSLLEK